MKYFEGLEIGMKYRHQCSPDIGAQIHYPDWFTLSMIGRDWYFIGDLKKHWYCKYYKYIPSLISIHGPYYILLDVIIYHCGIKTIPIIGQVGVSGKTHLITKQQGLGMVHSCIDIPVIGFPLYVQLRWYQRKFGWG